MLTHAFNGMARGPCVSGTSASQGRRRLRDINVSGTSAFEFYEALGTRSLLAKAPHPLGLFNCCVQIIKHERTRVHVSVFPLRDSVSSGVKEDVCMS